MEFILVLGSKPESNLPDINVSKIYTANGAAERATYFRKKYSQNILTCLAGAREFARNEHVSQRIIKAQPENFIIRSGIIEKPIELNNTKLIFLKNYSQWSFQSKFFRNKKVSLILSEFFHQLKFTDKILHILKSIKNKNIWGVSTGFFAILLALEENPNSKIIISGIGMKGGKQFYKSERSNHFVYDSRARVDRFLVKKMFKKYKERLCTLDPELAEIASISLWRGDLLQLQ